MSKTIAVLIDHSDSMRYYGYLEYAKTDAASFVNIMQKNDSCAVIEFSDNADIIQPLTVLASQSVTDAICKKILAITSANLTNIGDAIVKGNAQSVKSMVLLSDGEWNVPPDPLTVLPPYPIYTIALGNSGVIATMQAIAQQTGGTYHFAPGYRELQRVYNQIAQDSSIADTVTNELESVNAYGYREISSTFSPGIDCAKLAISWDDTNVTYTPGTPTGNQVNISITDPSGAAFTDAPVFIGPAGVVFNIPNPAPGVWTVGCWYAGQVGGRALGCVWGGFEPNGTAKLEIKAKQTTFALGESGGLDIEFSDAGGPIANPSIRATLESPLMSLKEAMQTHADTLQMINVETNSSDAADEHLAKIAAFEGQTGRPLIPVSCTPLRAQLNENGSFHLDIPGNNMPCHATLHIVAEGISQKTGAPVKRTHHMTLVIG